MSWANDAIDMGLDDDLSEEARFLRIARATGGDKDVVTKPDDYQYGPVDKPLIEEDGITF